jgi:hypothetical protein
MQYAILENGNLKLMLEDEDVEDVTDILEARGNQDHLLLSDLFEHAGWPGNGILYAVMPEHVSGALTDSPIISDDVAYPDDGSVLVRGNVWWFPNYPIRNFCRDLLEDRQVIFTAAPENATRKKD